MTTLIRKDVRATLLSLLLELGEDWEYSDEITEKTGIFRDLGFESVDAVALGSAIEEHFKCTLPFPEFLANAYKEEWRDITVGQLTDFLMTSLNGAARN